MELRDGMLLDRWTIFPVQLTVVDSKHDLGNLSFARHRSKNDYFLFFTRGYSLLD